MAEVPQQGEIIRKSRTSVTLGFSDGVETTMRCGSLELPSPDRSTVDPERNRQRTAERKVVEQVLGLTVRRKK